MGRANSSLIFNALAIVGVLLSVGGLAITLRDRRADAPTDAARSAASSPSVAAPRRVKFRDIYAESGLNYRLSMGAKSLYTIQEGVGHGCALLDYDNDGNLDILLIGPKLALYKGDGHGHFQDVTHATGLDKIRGDFRGCAVADYDNDGYDDIYLTALQGGVLLHNEGGKRFTDVTARMGIKPQPWGSSAAFADLDGDGRLYLFIGNYIKKDIRASDHLPRDVDYDPCRHDPDFGVLYRYEGDRFRDVSRQFGIVAPYESGKCLGAAFADFDQSGRQSLALADDVRPGDLFVYRNGKYRNVAKAVGVAFGPEPAPHGGMGIDWGDYDNDGRLDMVVTTFSGEVKCLYHNQGGVFRESSGPMGLQVPTKPYVGFGVKFLDCANEGWLDLIVANGDVNDFRAMAARQRDTTVHSVMDTRAHDAPLFQKTQLFLNAEGRRFEEAGSLAGPAFDRPILGRGLAIGDFDNDGRMDVLVVDDNGSPLLLHNETPSAGHWLECRLVGVKSNRDGIGAMLAFETPGGRKLLRRCATDGSYLSASDKRVHCGLGEATRATITVRWPSGHTDVFRNIAADRIVTLREGQSQTETAPRP